MFFNSLTIQNYASHASTSLHDLSAVTVLVGPNGAGKSTAFEAIRTLSRLLTGPTAQAFGPTPYSFEDKLYRGASSDRTIGFHVECSETEFPARITIDFGIGFTGCESPDDPPSVVREVVYVGGDCIFDRNRGHSDLRQFAATDLPPDQTLLSAIRNLPRSTRLEGPQALDRLVRRAGSVVNYRLEPRQLSWPSQEPDIDSFVRIGYEGDNLAGLLWSLKRENGDLLDRIVADLRRAIPDVRGIALNTVGVDRVGFSLEYDDARRRVLAPNVSSGTLLLLGLITLLNSPSLPNIVCIEEPETGLTPDAVRLFFNLLVKAANDRNRHTQFFFSSHSPFVLCDAWNKNAPDRSFVRRMHIEQGHTVVEDIESIIERGDSGAVLKKDRTGERARMGLKAAEELLCGRFLS